MTGAEECLALTLAPGLAQNEEVFFMEEREMVSFFLNLRVHGEEEGETRGAQVSY